MAEVTKRALLTGIGDGYFQEMTTEDTEESKPVYGEVKAVPSLQSIEVELSYESNNIFLSSKHHSDLGRLTGTTINVNAGYLPENFEEEMTGAEKLAEGVYSYGDQATRKFFRFAFPMRDENGEEVIINFPKCQLEPIGMSGQTETEQKEAQIPSYNIVGHALVYRGASEEDKTNSIYLRTDLRNKTAKETYDRKKLLEQGWYDRETLEATKK